MLRTAAGVWITSRLALAMVGIGTLYREGYALFLAVAMVLVWFDLGYGRERLLYANLGISTARLVVFAGVAVVVLDVALGFAVNPAMTLISLFVPRFAL